MGNHHSHGGGSISTKHTTDSAFPSRSNSQNGSRKGMSRSPSGSDIQDNTAPTSQLVPVERLAKILSEKSHEEDGVHGITQSVFIRYLFPRYPVLGERLYRYFYTSSVTTKNKVLGKVAFQQQCEKFLSVLDDGVARDIMVKIFSVLSKDGQTEVMTPETMRSLLMCSYHISMDHYSEGPQMCFSINKTLKAVVDGCFHTKSELSVQFVSHWLAANCSRLLLPLHRYAVHSLATSYRVIETEGPPPIIGLELATPVLEHPPPFGNNHKPHPHLLQMSMSWLLAGALPPVYSRPQRANSPSSSGVGLSSTAFLQKLLCAVPSHWVNLYDSDDMGLGCNRFLNHVLSYKGPTLMLIRVEGGSLFCIASVNEWKESHLYWGGEESAVCQLLPKFSLLDKGSKLLYLNTAVRGYPLGLRAGRDPRKPIIAVDGGFEKMEFSKIPYAINRIEVWGCGDPASREQQLEIKKWQVKEAEKQRCVKLSATDWLDHPDRYLLELAGRPQYHQSQT